MIDTSNCTWRIRVIGEGEEIDNLLRSQRNEIYKAMSKCHCVQIEIEKMLNIIQVEDLSMADSSFNELISCSKCYHSY